MPGTLFVAHNSKWNVKDRHLIHNRILSNLLQSYEHTRRFIKFSQRQINEFLRSTRIYSKSISHLFLRILNRHLKSYFNILLYIECFVLLFCFHISLLIRIGFNWPISNYASISESCQKNTKSSKAHQVSLVADEESLFQDWLSIFFTSPTPKSWGLLCGKVDRMHNYILILSRLFNILAILFTE